MSCQLAGGIGLPRAPVANPPSNASPPNPASEPADPPSGSGVSRVTVPAVPARGGTLVVMPALQHMTRARAEAALRAAGRTGSLEVVVLDGPERSTEVCQHSPTEGGQAMAHLGVTITMCPPDAGPHVQPVLAGLSPAAATARAKAAGFTGKIEVLYSNEYDASCKAETVCRVTPLRWEIDQDPSMQLWLNPKMTISTPD